MRNPEWTQQRKFQRGEVFNVMLPNEPTVPPDPSRVMYGKHRCVVLFDSKFPRKTVTILPITSLYNRDGERKKTYTSDLILDSSEYKQSGPTYKNTIIKDSFIRTEQIRAISRHLLEDKVGELLPKDMTRLDITLISSLNLQKTINQLIEIEVERRMSAQHLQQQSMNNRQTDRER